MLKPLIDGATFEIIGAAAFGRLCVETFSAEGKPAPEEAAAFGRLCVETDVATLIVVTISAQPPSGGCVLKLCQHQRRGQ